MARREYTDVLTTSEARVALPNLLARARGASGKRLDPVVIGAHRKAEAVLISYADYERLMDLLDDVAITAEVEERDRRDRGKRLDLDEVIRELGFDPAEFEV